MKLAFYVTKEAGKDVAGQRNPGVGNPIQLTAEQAAHPLRQGYITEEKPEAARKPAATKFSTAKNKKQ